VEIALTNEANVANFNGSITSPWARFPKGVAISRILDPEFFTVDIVVHEGRQARRTEKERNDGRYYTVGLMGHDNSMSRGVNHPIPKGKIRHEANGGIGDLVEQKMFSCAAN
jgi:hypothetical protein